MRARFLKGGFTLIEVAVALLVLSMALVTFIGAQSQSVDLIEKARDLTFLTEVARRKMAELELEFNSKSLGEIKDSEEGVFDDEELEGYRWKYELKKLELPQTGVQLGAMQEQQQVGTGLITDILEQTVKWFELRIIWGDEAKGEYMSVRTLRTNSKGLPKINMGALLNQTK